MQFQGRLELRVRASAAEAGSRQVEVEILKSTVDDRKVERRAVKLLSDWALRQPFRVGAFETKVSYEAG